MCVALAGCERVPSINLLGAYFPSWMACAIAGITLTLIARWIVVSAGVEGSLGPRSVVYPALALAFSIVTWLIVFRG
jgi:hypothetical protein